MVGFAFTRRQRRFAERPVRDLVDSRDRARVSDGNIRLAKWIDRHVSEGEIVSHGDMGYVPYVNPDIRFLDLNGLVTREVAHLTGKASNAANTGDELRAETSLGRFLREAEPDYLIPRDLDLSLHLGDEIFNGQYRVVANIPVDATRHFTVFGKKSVMNTAERHRGRIE